MNRTLFIALAAMILIIGSILIFLDLRQKKIEETIVPNASTHTRETPERITKEGSWECLPHKDQSGPQTLECAFGLAVDQSDAHYALDLSLLSQGPIGFPTGTKIRVEGVLVPKNEYNQSKRDKYPIDGIIAVTSVQKL